MKIVILVILTIGLLFLSGCAAGIVGKIPEVDDNFATVYIARKDGRMGCGNAFLIQLNDKDFIRLDCGMKTNFKIPAGEKIKVSSASSAIPDNFFLEPVGGEKYYFGMDCNFGACWFDRLLWEGYSTIANTCSRDLIINQDAKKTTTDNTKLPQTNISDTKKYSLETNNDSESNRVNIKNPDDERIIPGKSEISEPNRQQSQADLKGGKEALETKGLQKETPDQAR